MTDDEFFVLHCYLIVCKQMSSGLFKMLSTNDSITNYIRGTLNKFPDFFRMGTFIDRTHMQL